MQIYSIKSFYGRNIYSHRPVIKMILDIGELHKAPTKDIEGFNVKLLKLFPGLNEHHCCMGEKGGFVQRLEEGTYIGHVTEHLILELQNILGYGVFYGKTRIIEEPSLYYIVFEYINEKCGIECAKAAVHIISDMAENREIDIISAIENLKTISVQSDLGPSTKAIFDEAKRRGIPVTRLGNDSILQLGYGKFSRQIEASLTDYPSCIAVDIAGNKHLTKEILMNNGIPVPFGDVAYTEESAVKCAEEIGYPVVVKPYDGNQGKGVVLNICNKEQVCLAYKEVMKFSKVAIVEKYITGKDYRVLVVGDRVAAVSERRPPSVVGDGTHSIKELVEIENNNSQRGEDHEKPLTRIKLDEVARQVLQRVDINEKYIPALNEVIYLRDNSNLSTGGTARDCTGKIHPFNCHMAIKAARSIGLDIAGIDITAEDIAQPINSLNGAVIEVNAAPGLRMHLYPSEGEKNNVAERIVDMLYPKNKPFSIPIVSITGTNGKTTTTRIISHTLTLTGKKVGMTCTSGIYIDKQCVQKGDNTGPVSARMVLSNKNIDAAVLETARGGIVRKGLGYDLADVGVIVNVSDDHLGLDGINSLQDLAFVKSLVIEAVKPDGHCVLNADDEMAEYLMKRAVGRKLLFSREESNTLISKHIAGGGKAVYVKDNVIFLRDGEKIIPLLDIVRIPITFGGIVECNIENSLAAASALYALGLDIEDIRNGLLTFKPDIKSNPGRFNIFDMGSFKVMLDYSHNIAGYNAVISFISRMDAKRLVGVVGMPGDRLDRNIKAVGHICGKAFSKVYIKEDVDLRGRRQGETAQLLLDEMLQTGMKRESIHIIHSELKALETAMLDAQPDDLIVMFYEEFDPAVELIMKFRNEMEKAVIQDSMVIKETV